MMEKYLEFTSVVLPFNKTWNHQKKVEIQKTRVLIRCFVFEGDNENGVKLCEASERNMIKLMVWSTFEIKHIKC